MPGFECNAIVPRNDNLTLIENRLLAGIVLYAAIMHNAQALGHCRHVSKICP